MRIAVGAAFIIQGAIYFSEWRDLRFLTATLGFLTLLSGALLLIGYLTPLAGIVAALLGVGGMFSWYPHPSPDLFEAKVAAGFATVIAAALVCVGPGASSLDSRLFGRREIIIPSADSSSKS